VVPGQIGLVQATEAIKVILNIGTPMVGKFFVYDALAGDYRLLTVEKNPDCPLCGKTPAIKDLNTCDYTNRIDEACSQHIQETGADQKRAGEPMMNDPEPVPALE
jgi:hypothetical protein